MPAQPGSPSDDASNPTEVVLHSTLRGLGSAAIAPTALLLFGGSALQGGFRVVPALVLAAGVVLAVISLYDMPRSSRFTAAGVTRVCVLREQHLPWEQVLTIERAPASTSDRLRSLQDRDRGTVASGGLVACSQGRKRFLLTDRAESNQEYQRLAALLDHTPAALLAAPPPDGTPPTDLYRRRRR